MAALTPTPTETGKSRRCGDFPTLTAALDYAATGAGGANFYTARGELVDALSYAEMREQARLAGGRLLARGLVPGDRVAIVAETDADFMRALMGCLYAGLIPCPVPLPNAFGSRIAYGDQLRRILAVADVRAALSPQMFREWVTESLADLNLLFAGTLAELDAAPESLPAADRDPGQIAYLQFSSGTTSFPKGVAVSHGAMMANIHAMAAHGLGIAEGDRGVNWLPYYHDMGLVGCVMLPIACQISLDCIATRDFILRPGIWLELVSRNRGTMSYSPSFGYDLAARRARHGPDLDLSSWRIAGIGGDMIRVSSLDAFISTFAPHGFRRESFLPSYGMAEAALGLTFAARGEGVRTERVDVARLRDEHIAVRPGRGARSREFALCGRPLPGHAVEVRDADGTVLPEGRIGQIFASGPSLMLGYFGNPDETARVLSADGWLDTGDLGYIRNGEVIVTGRSKDLIIINGRNIWPQDIEWAVEASVEGTKTGSVAAFQITDEADDGADGQRVALVMECRRREPAEREAMRSEARATVRNLCGIEPRVALCPAGLLPRTSSGKLSRSKARDMFLAGVFEG